MALARGVVAVWRGRRLQLARHQACLQVFGAGRRCPIPANGFYEWRSTPDGESPMWGHIEDGRSFAFVGLYGHDLDANSLIHPIHHQMPVILSLGELVVGPPIGHRRPPHHASPAPVDARSDPTG